MGENNNVLTVASQKKSNKFPLWQAATVLSTFGISEVAMAEDYITPLGTTASENMSAALQVVLGIFAVGIGIVGVFKGYQYLKTGTWRA